ncbi:MAG: group II intron maturase-specific domain-containing protein [Candidatus Binataceae bacterium]
MTRRGLTQRDVQTIVAGLNRLVIGWANYFCLGPLSRAYRAVERHARRRLCAKHKVPGAGTARYPNDVLHEEFGLVRLSQRTASLPWATP